MSEADLQESVLSVDPSQLVSWLLDEGRTDEALTRLDQLVTTELYAGTFSSVAPVLKSLRSLSESQRQTVAGLGLTAKVVSWFEVVCESLTSHLHRRSAPLFSLAEDFLDYFQLLTQESFPVPELSDVLLQLIRLSLKTEIHFPLRHEGIKTFNGIVETLSREQRRQIQAEQGQNPILFQVAAAILTSGDYELQGNLLEALCRLTPCTFRQEKAHLWFSCPDVADAFCDIRHKDFEEDCRVFLNLLNNSNGEQRRVHTFPCLRAFLNSTELFRPKDNKLDEFWVDFNVESGSVSFFIDEDGASLWGSIHLLKDNVDYYVLHIGIDEILLRVQLHNPVTYQGSRGHTVELTFSSELCKDLQRATEQVLAKPQSSEDLAVVAGDTTQEFPSGKTKRVMTYSRRGTRKRSLLKVLPLSSPSSEDDSSRPISKTETRSRAEILFDAIRESTPIASRVAEGEELRRSARLQRAEFGKNISPIKKPVNRKRKASDSAYLSDQTKISPSTKKKADLQDEEDTPLTIATESSPERAEPDLQQEEAGLDTQEEQRLPELRTELTRDITAAFKSFQSELQTHFTGCCKKVDAQVNSSLTECQQNVSSLLTAVQHSVKVLQTFESSISDHLKQFEEKLSTLNSINNQILVLQHEFQTVLRAGPEPGLLGTFSDDLPQRLKSLDGDEQKAEPPSGL